LVPAPPDGNPFRIHGVVSADFFTNRDQELARMARAFAEPGSKLLVYGPRRMGKTSALVRAIERHEARSGVALLADLSTTSSLADIANRILEAAGRALGRKWKDAIGDFVRRIGVSITLTPDPATGMILPSLEAGLRSAPLAEQRNTLAKALDAVEALAEARKTSVGIVLDEFQEIRRFGNEEAEWHLRGVIQHHKRVSYLLAGSEAHIIEGMLDKGRAFYGLADQLRFGPIAADHLAAWIDDRMTGRGVKAVAIGRAIGLAAGPRTRDVVQVARQCFDNCRARKHATLEDVPVAFDDVVWEQEAVFQTVWNDLPVPQQNVLRAVAANREGLTTKGSLRLFALASSGAAVNAAAALIGDGHLVRAESRTGYGFENPFFGRWVELETLGDLGAALPAPPA
jgi:hypothetical protein